jgi:hypothetical protein
MNNRGGKFLVDNQRTNENSVKQFEQISKFVLLRAQYAHGFDRIALLAVLLDGVLVDSHERVVQLLLT